MQSRLFFLLLFFCALEVSVAAENAYSIIPKPLKLTPAQGSFTITKLTTVVVLLDRCDTDSWQLSHAIIDFISKPLNEIQINYKNQLDRDCIVIELDEKADIDPEGYQLTITPERIHLLASTHAGLFYAFQTLRQLMPPVVEMQLPLAYLKIEVPCCTIHDAPRFKYRGLHLDVSRHFFSVAFIKRYLDLMATYKLNVFHWHLTDDQGWRIEIKKYPKLQEVAAHRLQTVIGSRTYPHKYDGIAHGGFYTRQEIKEVVEYARQRYITVIPEIELPGHCLAALAAYPELGCSGGPYASATRWGIGSDVYCAGNDAAFNFLEDVLDEVMELFPSNYVHIGGDEVTKTFWKACSKCQNRMKREGLNDEHELQSYFVKRIEKFVSSRGRTIIGWDEILEGGLADNAIVMSWRGVEGGIEAAKQNHRVIMTPHEHLYFDYYQSKKETEPFAIGGYLPLKKVYEYEPVPAGLDEKQAALVLGAQANVWTEYIATPQHVEYMVFPRALALAEVTWSSPAQKNYGDFIARLQSNKEHLNAMNVCCAPYDTESAQA